MHVNKKKKILHAKHECKLKIQKCFMQNMYVNFVKICYMQNMYVNKKNNATRKTCMLIKKNAKCKTCM